MVYFKVFMVIVIASSFILGYVLGRDKEYYDEKNDFEDSIRRANKRIDFDLSDSDGGFSVPPVLRPYVPEDGCSGERGSDSSPTDD